MEKRNKHSRWRISIFFIFLLQIGLMTGVIEIGGKVLYEKYYDFKIRNVKKIYISDEKQIGNIEENINNYGNTVKNDKYIFYLKDNIWLCRSDKEFKNEITLVKQEAGNGIGDLNIVGEYLFYQQGKNLIRRKIDGREISKLPMMNLTIDTHIIGNWIYFINGSKKNRGIYKMTINGEKLEKISSVEAWDMAIYNEKIYYSFDYDGERYLKYMDLDGENKKFIANIETKDMIMDHDFIYYINRKDNKLYKLNLGNNDIQLLVDEKISTFCKNDIWIYYSKNGKQTFCGGEGLYMIDKEGKNMKKIVNDQEVDNLSVIGEWIMYRSSKNREYPTLKRISRNGDEKIIME